MRKLLFLTIACLFMTAPVWAQCTHTIVCTDTYGDGWNGASVDVLVNSSIVLDDITCVASIDTYTFTADTGDAIDVVVNAQGSYPGECAYQVLDVNDLLLFEELSGGTFDSQSGTGNCVAVTPTPIAACLQTVSSYPYVEDFETGTIGLWTQATFDEMDWTLNQGTTGSTGTGPSVDHTTGTATGYYLYHETSSGVTGDSAVLYGVCFDVTGLTTPEFSFWYHMYGAAMGTLEVDITTDNGGTWTNIFSMTGDQGDTWHFAAFDWTAYIGQTVGVRFTSFRGTSYTSDAAIDDIRLGESSGPTPTPTITPTPEPGNNCLNPIVVDQSALPFADNNYTCGRGNDYDNTCLGSYDGGEDIIYELTINTDTGIEITLDPLGTTWTGMVLDSNCPPDPASCIATATNSGSTPYTITCTPLTAGTYYIMIDTWPSPACIPAFDLDIVECTPPPTPTPDPLLNCDVGVIYDQAYDGQVVYTNSDEDSGNISADDFSGLTDPIGGVTFWGTDLYFDGAAWGDCDKLDDDFYVTFYSDSGGLPGAVVATETVTATRQVTTINPFGNPAYGFLLRWDATLATPVSLASGWISIQGVTDSSGVCWFMWTDAGTLNGSDYVQDTGTGWAVSGYAIDLAFCLYPSTGPTPTPTTPPTATPTDTPEPTATPTGPTPTPEPIPATGPAGIGLLMLAIGALMSLAGIRRRK